MYLTELDEFHFCRLVLSFLGPVQIFVVLNILPTKRFLAFLHACRKPVPSVLQPAGFIALKVK